MSLKPTKKSDLNKDWLKGRESKSLSLLPIAANVSLCDRAILFRASPDIGESIFALVQIR